MKVLVMVSRKVKEASSEIMEMKGKVKTLEFAVMRGATLAGDKRETATDPK